MQVLVNGVRLFFDIEGASLVPDGPTMREEPTLLFLHGGLGFDHSNYKPAFLALADIAQVVFLDHRGNGRSDPGFREAWTLAQWGDDVREARLELRENIGRPSERVSLCRRLLGRPMFASGTLCHVDRVQGRGDRLRRPWTPGEADPIPRFPLYSHIDSL